MTIKLGNRLAAIRKQNGYSQEDLAEKLGVSRQAISKWECGEASPDTDNLIELARIYNMSLDELLEIENKNDKHEEQLETSKAVDQDIKVTIKKDDVLKRRAQKIDTIISSIFTLCIVITYIALGCLIPSMWGKAWVLFLLIPILPSIIEVIRYKNMKKFCYPVLVVFVYLLVCIWFGLNLWHPLWVLFLTIPVYYIIGDLVNKIFNIQDTEDDDEEDDKD